MYLAILEGLSGLLKLLARMHAKTYVQQHQQHCYLQMTSKKVFMADTIQYITVAQLPFKDPLCPHTPLCILLEEIRTFSFALIYLPQDIRKKVSPLIKALQSEVSLNYILDHL